MSIVKLGKNSYRIFVSAGGKAGADGERKRLRHTERFTGTYRAAQQREAKIRTDIAAGRIKVGDSTTFGEYVETTWWPQKLSRLSPTTLRGYRSILDNYLLPAIKDKPLQQLKKEDITPVTGALAAAGKLRMAKNVHVLASTIFESAARDEIIGRSPMYRLAPPKPRDTEMQTLTPAQVRTVLTTLQERDSWAYVPIALLITSGLRRSELCGLQWGDYDADSSIITVKRSYHLLPGGRAVVKMPKTKRGRRTVALDHNTNALLVAHREADAARYRLFDVDLTPDKWMFSRADGAPWPPDTYSQLWGRLADDLGLNVRLHDLRHTSASLMLAKGVNVKLVSERLGHSSTSFTMDTYIHLLDGAQAEAAEMLAALLSGDAVQSSDVPRALP